jgi:hypothetical protein
MISKEVRQDVIESINGVRKDLEIIRQNLNEMQNMLYRCSTEKEFKDWLRKHDPESGTKYIMIFGE